MARINWETTAINADVRFQDLMIKVGDRQAAKGLMLDLFELGQKYWFPDKKPIPERLFAAVQRSFVAVEVGLAKKVEGGYYVCGSEEQFAWLFQRQEAGKSSGERRKAKKKRKLKDLNEKRTAVNDCSTTVERKSTGPQRQPTSSLSSLSSSLSSLSSSLSSQDSLLVSEGVQEPPPQPISETPTRRVWEAYSNAYYDRYKTEPKWNAQVGGQLKNFVSRLGKDDAPHVARFYISHSKAYYVQNMHPVGAMVKDAESLYAQWKTNRMVTNADARRAEKDSYWKNQMQEVEGESLNG